MEHHGLEASVYLWHFLAGLGFAGIGAIAQQWCEHWRHQLMIGVIGVMLETLIVVTAIG
jgi:hypothetical protein